MALIELNEGKGSGVGADYLRCNRCGFLDRSDFMARRFQETWSACRKCGGHHVVDNFKMVADEEWDRISGGFYDYYRQREGSATPPVGDVGGQGGGSTA